MKIKSMTAVFGKLTGQRLELAPGFNLIEAPNEGGKDQGWYRFLSARYPFLSRSRVSMP